MPINGKSAHLRKIKCGVLSPGFIFLHSKIIKQNPSREHINNLSLLCPLSLEFVMWLFKNNAGTEYLRMFHFKVIEQQYLHFNHHNSVDLPSARLLGKLPLYWTFQFEHCYYHMKSKLKTWNTHSPLLFQTQLKTGSFMLFETMPLFNVTHICFLIPTYLINSYRAGLKTWFKHQSVSWKAGRQ